MAAPLLSLKSYQQQSLANLEAFLASTIKFGKASTAFIDATNRPYYELPQLEGLPYVCLRVPTGGGKTIMAAHSIARATDSYLRIDNPTVVWLVPSKTILEQTLSSLQDRTNPNRRALADRFGENVRVMGIADALYAKRADYDGGACIIVSTLQAFRVEEDKDEGRKVYEGNGELMDHFTGLDTRLRASLEMGPGDDPVPSLANVLRLRRPMVIVDEAHNARTELSFDTLARLKPSLIVEFTATPVTATDHNPAKGVYASNVLHHVSAAELKAADMIKLPVILRGRPDPKETIADAIAWLDELVITAKQEGQETGEFVRPVMLIQSEAKSKDRPTLHAEEVKKLLMEDFRVPAAHIALATGESRELDKVDLFDPTCAVRFVITQQALREGWDCSFAYVLCSVAEQKSPRAVEQLLGRVLRLPYAQRKRREDLNRAYAFATTTAFKNAAQTLQDGLVANGFEEIEAKALVMVDQATIKGLEEGGSAFVYEEVLPEGLDANTFKTNVEKATGGRVQVDLETGQIKARGALSDYDKTALLLAIPEAAAKAVEALVHKSRGARLKPVDAASAAIQFAVPRLGVRRGNTLELFDRAHFLDIPWKLEACDASEILKHFTKPKNSTDEAHIDVSKAGQVTVNYVSDLHEQLALALQERGWTKNALINWLDRRLPRSHRLDITPTSTRLFISKALDEIETRMGLGIEGLARAKYPIVEALLRTIAIHRDVRQATAFEKVLFPQSGVDFKTDSEVALVFTENNYGYNKPYKGGTIFKKHLFRVIGDLESAGEEFDCAVHIERLPQVKSWVRNTVKQPHSFWLQTSSDKFYPDFVALLEDGRYLVVEYKGSHISSADDAKEKLKIGELWAERSKGKCLFVMISDREFGGIEAVLRT